MPMGGQSSTKKLLVVGLGVAVVVMVAIFGKERMLFFLYLFDVLDLSLFFLHENEN